MNYERFEAMTARYPRLRIGVVGDFCLDRYLEIDPARAEESIETGLPVYNIVNVRSQPGAAGTILSNLVALGVGEIAIVGFCGEDGEGYELERALRGMAGVNLDGLVRTPHRHTFVYCKPLVMTPGHPPRELNRLDTKNWSPTPTVLQRELADHVTALARRVDALVLMDQVDQADTGVVTRLVYDAAHAAARERAELLVLADSRRGVRHLPPLGFKTNAAEFGELTPGRPLQDLPEIKAQSATIARQNGQPVFVTLAERGIIGALADGRAEHVSAHPVRGPIDIVGAGDSVTANLIAALAAGAGLVESMEVAMAAASIVIHQLGTTGTASVAQVANLLFDPETRRCPR